MQPDPVVPSNGRPSSTAVPVDVGADALGAAVSALSGATAGNAVSELVANGVRHGGVSGVGVVAIGVRLAGREVRSEVQDPGRGGMVATRAPDLNGGGGFALHVVQALSAPWGFERVAGEAARHE